MAEAITVTLDNGTKVSCASSHGSQMFRLAPLAYDMGCWFQQYAIYVDTLEEAQDAVSKTAAPIYMITHDDVVLEHNVPSNRMAA